MVICESCGIEIEEEEAIEINGHKYCEECVITCVDCGKKILVEESIDSEDGAICEDCRNNDYFMCNNCGAIVSRCELNEIYNGERDEWWCDSCKEDYAYYCFGCESYFTDDFGQMDRHGDWYCENCIDHGHGYFSDTRIGNYHSHCFETIGAKREVGFELEIDSNTEENEKDLIDELSKLYGNSIIFERDSSLSDYGIEIITQPHSLEEFNNTDWSMLLTICRKYGYTSHNNGRCGLHIHLSKELFGRTTEEREEAIDRLQIFYSNFWSDIKKISRRKDYRYCKKIFVDDETDKKRTVEVKKYILENDYECSRSDRYKAINRTNYETVEIRIMRGTLRYESFISCIEFAIHTALKAKELTDEDTMDKNKWLDGLSETCVEYIKDRGAFGNEISEDIRKYIRERNLIPETTAEEDEAGNINADIIVRDLRNMFERYERREEQCA